MKRIYAITAATMIAAAAAQAEITLPDIIGDNMVLQQDTTVRIWGWTDSKAPVRITPSWNPQASVTAEFDSDGRRWHAALQTPAASFRPHGITIENGTDTLKIENVLSGEVWFCSGQSNMEMPLRGFWTQPVEGAAEAIAYAARYPGIRVAKVPKQTSYTPQEKTIGTWKTSNPANARDFSALAYFFAGSLTRLLNVPIGIIDCSYGGSKVEAWQPRRQLEAYPEFDIDKEMADTAMNDWERINVMYNAMLHPLAGYTIKGFLWNQGEANVGRHATYPDHLKEMVECWREEWNDDSLPFYFVEIPGWNYGDPDATDAALFRECQHKAAEIIPNSAIISTADLVYPHEVNDIHASKKKEIGERLAFIAAEKTYGMEGMPTEYPRYKSMTVDGDKAILTFTGAPEGFTPNTQLEGFEAAGDDGVFHKAYAIENPNTLNIEVSCPEAKEIKAVRYNFHNFRVGKVFNTLGLPLIPFRTDNPHLSGKGATGRQK